MFFISRDTGMKRDQDEIQTGRQRTVSTRTERRFFTIFANKKRAFHHLLQDLTSNRKEPLRTTLELFRVVDKGATVAHSIEKLLDLVVPSDLSGNGLLTTR